MGGYVRNAWVPLTGISTDTREFNRKEHIDHIWLQPSELKTLDWAKADEALIDYLMR